MRDEIEKYLGAVSEASAKRISERIGLPQFDVAKEMNRMHADGVVEREKRPGGGNEYVYWLSSGKQAAASEAATAIASSGTHMANTEAETEPAEPAPMTDEVALEKLIGETYELLKILGLPSEMTKAIAAASTLQEIAKATSIERDELRVELESQQAANARLKQNNAALEHRIDELTLGPVGSKAPLFVTVGRYAKPQRHDSLERARRRGERLVRGEKESEVLVLEPIGRIVRGAEWQPR